MSENLTVEQQKHRFEKIRMIEENGGTTKVTKKFWPFSNHSVTSTPVKTFRAKLRRPSSWDSSDEVFSSGSAATASQVDSGLGASSLAATLTSKTSTTAKVDVGLKRGVMGMATAVDLAKAGKPEDEDDYPLDYVWDSETEERRAQEGSMCKKCTR